MIRYDTYHRFKTFNVLPQSPWFFVDLDTSINLILSSIFPRNLARSCQNQPSSSVMSLLSFQKVVWTDKQGSISSRWTNSSGTCRLLYPRLCKLEYMFLLIVMLAFDLLCLQYLCMKVDEAKEVPMLEWQGVLLCLLPMGNPYPAHGNEATVYVMP